MRGQRRHCVTLQQPTQVPDGDGGFTETWVALDPPTLWVHIAPPPAQDLEERRDGTVIGLSTLIMESDFHPGITTLTRIVHDGTVCACGTAPVEYSIVGCSSPEARRQRLSLRCVEVVT